MRICQFVLSMFATGTIGTTAHAAPYVPNDSQQVIERVPVRADPVQRELRSLRSELSANPRNLSLATALARRYIEVGRSEGDPRYFGYAQAALAPWWEQKDPPAGVRVLRATLFQNRHHFAFALDELNAVLKVDSRHPQAWLTRATILQVQGEYELAKNSCTKLYGLVPELIATACTANVSSLSGKPEESYVLLKQALATQKNAGIDVKAWSQTLLAEMAVRQGQAAAEVHFRQALMLTPDDNYLLGAYADFLLDKQRPAEVVEMLNRHTRADGLLLRHTIALKRLGSAKAEEQIAILQSRFAAARLRDDDVHQRERARFELELLDQPKEALRTAQRNWQTQKEPADARILLEAAAASNDRIAASGVLDWIKSAELHDIALAALARRLGEPS